MDKKEMKAQKKRKKFKDKQEKLIKSGRFKLWRTRRPFWGATLTLIAGLMILYIPLQLWAIAFAPGSFAFVGLLFGGLILIIGALAFIYPQFSTVFGVLTLFLSVLSIMGALGGFVVGTICGILGGSLLIAWKQQVIPSKADRDWQQKASAIEGGKEQTASSKESVHVPEQTEMTTIVSGVETNQVSSAVDSPGKESPVMGEKRKPTKRDQMKQSRKKTTERVPDSTASTQIYHEDKKNEKREA